MAAPNSGASDAVWDGSTNGEASAVTGWPLILRRSAHGLPVHVGDVQDQQDPAAARPVFSVVPYGL